MISPAPINSTAIGGGSTDSIPLNQKIQASAAANPTETQTHPPNRPDPSPDRSKIQRSKAEKQSNNCRPITPPPPLAFSTGSLLMDEKRQMRLGVALHKKNTFAGGLIESSNSDNDPDLQDSWVIVEKQRVRIVIPPLPVATKSPPPNPGPVQLRPVARQAEGNESQFPVETETCPKTTSVHEQKKIKSLAPKRVVQVTRKSPAAEYVSTFPKPMKRDLRMGLRNPDQIATSESHRTLGVSKTSKAIIQPRRLRRGPSIFTDQGMLLNQKLRALNLERKLQGAGGLTRWLASLGLGQFVRIFKRKGLSKVQLVNLTMKKLKDMGASAVGPRRKLMHAIDCFCQPCLYKKHSGIHLGPS